MMRLARLKRRGPASWIRSAALIVALVLAQTVVAGHVDLDDSHDAGAACTLCIAVAHLGAANVSSGVVVNPEIHREFGAPEGPGPVLYVSATCRFARGPPEAS